MDCASTNTNIQLVNQAKSSDPNERLAAVSRIRGFTSEYKYAAEFVSIGVLPVLVNCLESTDDKLFAEAGRALGEIAEVKAREVVDAGALPPLVKLLQSPDMELCKKTVEALDAIAEVNKGREIVEAGAVPFLVKLLQSPNMDLCASTALALANIVDNYNAHEVVEAGALPPLLKLLESPDPDVVEPVEFAMECIIKELPNLNGCCIEEEHKRKDAIYFLEECEGLQKIEQLNTKESELVLKMIEKIHSSKGCVVCCDKKIDFVFIPCWHACVCEECEQKIGDTCPMCRQISSKQRIYLP
ncbi:hypothetical protein GPALN_005805 [Globodera pallida]|nr:hypothetical protein GPALN_005805 [Globodera pallida]